MEGGASSSPELVAPATTVEHPPHVHRLLRLIREGTPSHASRASALLGRYAASCSRGCGGGGGGGGGDDDDDDCGVVDGGSITRPVAATDPGTIIWDLIGRLVGGEDGGGDRHGEDGGGGGGKMGGEDKARRRKRGKKGKRRTDEGNDRPTSGLFDPNWSTRANCALALEHVARCLPAEDRRHFFEGDDGGDGDGDDVDGGDVDSSGDDAPEENRKSKYRADFERMGGDDRDEEASPWLDVDDLRRAAAAADDARVRHPAGWNRMDVVVERGRLLLSSSGEEYDWDIDDEAREYIREREALQSLDATAIVGCEPREILGCDDLTTGIFKQQQQQESFLKRRVALQRRILARRLGLGGILNAPILVDGNHGRTPEEGAVSSSGITKRRRIIDDIVDDEDLAPVMGEKVQSPKIAQKEGGVKRSKKCQPTDNVERTPDGSKRTDGGISIRALLVLESKKSATNEGCSDRHSKRAARHRNPQTLLGSELAYRTFDPDWTVRHGALLGTLALLRAWKVHAPSRRTLTKGKKFGRWPRDILARCVCILALDQFADFSGVSCDDGGANDADGILSGAIVAPVREMAAQIVAILLEAASPETSVSTHDLLAQLYTRQCRSMAVRRGNNGWEIRHGILLAWKYICAMALFHSNSNGQSRTPSLTNMIVDTHGLRPLSTSSMMILDECVSPSFRSILNSIILQSIRGLSDVSDDNRAVAAQVIRLSLLLNASLHTIDIPKESSKPLWQAITTIRDGVSSCAADLLHLLAELLSRGCASFIRCLQEVLGSLSLGSILHKLIDFIDDDSIPVKISCYCALRMVAEPIAKAILDGADTVKSGCNSGSFQSMSDCAATLSRLLARLFETYSMPAYICKGDREACNEGTTTYDDSTRELSNSRNQAWSAILRAVALLTQSNSADARSVVDDTFIELTLRYFGISRSFVPSKDNINHPSSYIFTRLPYSVGVGESAIENAFVSRLTLSHALSEFFAKIYSKERPFFLSRTKAHEDLLRLLQFFLQSPWFSQCEAGYLLHTSIASSVEPGCPFFARYLPTMLSALEINPLCTILEEYSGSSEALNDTKVQSICDNGLAMLLDSEAHLSSEDVVKVWESTFFTVSGISLGDLHKSSKTPLTVTSMRSSALISGALIACGSQYLPLKVTPLIRALMTSLKNEECQSRRVETCRHISKMMSILSENNAHKKARNKLMESVCALACSADANQKGAEHVIELLIGGMSATENLEDFTPIWQRLLPLMKTTFPNLLARVLPDSIYMLRVISSSMSKRCSSFKCVLELFMASAVEVACLSSEPLQVLACASIRNFCKIDFVAAMDLIVPPLLSHLSDLQNNLSREGGCNLLLSILREFEVLASPYVMALLPIVMRLMTDAVEECSRLATSAFAILVRIAPLAASHMDIPGHESSNQKVGRNVSNDVIRHLILGKPLPPCAVPEIILSFLGKSGTTLRPYQMEGISWLRFLADVHLNGALCDDMGLGKTLQALIAVAMSHHAKISDRREPSYPRSLVICPSSVVAHWISEIQRFFPGNEIFAPFDYTGSAKSRLLDWRGSFHQSNIVVTSYSVLRNDIDILEDVSWEWIILDEGHLLKNPKTSTAKASRRLKSHHKLILTGTPIQNNVHEIWATFDFLLPNFLGSESSFLREFAKPIVKSQSSGASSADTYQGMESLKILHQQVLPFVLRREKSQVIRELPPKIITDVPCSLSKQQYIMYQQTLKRSGMKEALDMVDDSIVGDATCTPKIGSQVLASLLQLRLICTHPLLFTLFSSKTDRDASPRSFTRIDCSGKLSALNDLLRHAGIAEPEITAADNDQSGYMIDHSENTSDNGSDIDYLENDNFDICGDKSTEQAINFSKCLVFAQFTQSLDIVERMLFEPHMPSLQYLRLDGRVPEKQRKAVVDRFNQDKDIKILLLTTKVGGLGLNLTGADKVIFLEPDWNPFVDLQAMDRAHRIGQTRTVNVYRLITSDTIEEKMMDLQRRKKATSDAVVNSDNSTMYSMGTDRLLDIFTCRGGSGTAASSSRGDAGDDILSYLDHGSTEEYSSLSVDGFIRGLG